MRDIERGGYVPPDNAETPKAERPDDGSREREIAAADGRARGEAATERRTAKERIAEVLWQRPKQFVSHVLAKGMAGPLKRFLAVFGGLGDDAMLTDDLKKLRAQAQKAADDAKND